MAESSLSHWETYWKSNPEALVHKEIIEQIQRVMEPRGRKVLEIGGGTGVDSIELARLGAESTVLDYSPEALKTVRLNAERAGVDIATVQADAENIPLPGESFDLIFSQGLIEHFKDSQKVVSEHFRLAKGGGFVLIDVPQKYNLYTLKKAREIRRGTWFAGWETQFSAAQLKSIFRSNGFTVVGVYGRGVPDLLQRMKSIGNAGERRIGRPYIGRRASPVWLDFWNRINEKIAPYTAISVGVIGRK